MYICKPTALIPSLGSHPTRIQKLLAIILYVILNILVEVY